VFKPIPAWSNNYALEGEPNKYEVWSLFYVDHVGCGRTVTVSIGQRDGAGRLFQKSLRSPFIRKFTVNSAKDIKTLWSLLGHLNAGSILPDQVGNTKTAKQWQWLTHTVNLASRVKIDD